MRMVPTQCPKCSAPLVKTEDGYHFACKALMGGGDSRRCLTYQRDQARLERDQLLQKLQQLKEAGNQMAFEVPYADRFDGWKAWRKLTKDMK